MKRPSAVRIVGLALAVGVWTAVMLHAQDRPAPASSAASAEAEFPDGVGRETFVNTCSQCHEPGLAVEARQSRDGWKKVIVAMEDRGAVLTKEDTTIIVDYLTEHFGTVLNVNKARAKEIGAFLKLTAEEATALVRFRDANGPFKNWADLIKAPGLDVRKIEGKKDALTF